MEVAGGGNKGRTFRDSVLLWWFWSFLGIPGKCSQENGTRPGNRRGVAGLDLEGESLGKIEEPPRVEQEEREEEECVRREEGWF